MAPKLSAKYLKSLNFSPRVLLGFAIVALFAVAFALHTLTPVRPTLAPKPYVQQVDLPKPSDVRVNMHENRKQVDSGVLSAEEHNNEVQARAPPTEQISYQHVVQKRPEVDMEQVEWVEEGKVEGPQAVDYGSPEPYVFEPHPERLQYGTGYGRPANEFENEVFAAY